MSAQSSIAIAPHRFAYGYYRQSWWNWLIGTAFFFGEIGAGLFLVSLLTGPALGMLVGYLIVMAGKNTAHLMYLGRPARFWRAAMRPDRSWIARGIWATGIFGASGALLLLPQFFPLPWQPQGATASAVTWLAGLSALFIMFYDGFVMNSSRAIPFWNTGMLPLLCLTYAALGGTTLSLTLRELTGLGEAAPSLLVQVEYILLVTNFVLLAMYLAHMWDWSPAARETVRMLVVGRYARFFLGLVLAVGLVATLLLAVVHSRMHATWLAILIAACELTGDFALLMVLLKSGLFSPQTAPAFRSS
ncbi:MAG TPA: DmsC/YnfH family molybdoenzyme membrane anchor subunit [Terriglobales bacterium]|nr:DmsC/YnfH family molybdoenzyme membrane anchor subunit [Terriglobales bacterium]